jgi:hypothetical protein
MSLKNNWRTPTVVLICGGLIMTLAMGARHGFGLFLQPMSASHGWGRETFAFALALQNLVWGIATPFAGLIADRFGAGRVLFTGSVLYVVGLVWMAYAGSGAELALSSGVMIGLGLSGTTFSIVYGVLGRIYPPEKRSMALGIAGAAGSFGQFAMLPATQALITGAGWLNALLVLAVAAALMAPLRPCWRNRIAAAHRTQQRCARCHPRGRAPQGFWLLTFGYFVCGFQVVFIACTCLAYSGRPRPAGQRRRRLPGADRLLQHHRHLRRRLAGPAPQQEASARLHLRRAQRDHRDLPRRTADALVGLPVRRGHRHAVAGHRAADQRHRRPGVRRALPVDAGRLRLLQPPDRQLPRA